LTKNDKNQIVIREMLPKTLSYEKGACKMLVKLTPGANFTKILSKAF